LATDAVAQYDKAELDTLRFENETLKSAQKSSKGELPKARQALTQTLESTNSNSVEFEIEDGASTVAFGK
jgi:ribosomal protein L10